MKPHGAEWQLAGVSTFYTILQSDCSFGFAAKRTLQEMQQPVLTSIEGVATAMGARSKGA